MATFGYMPLYVGDYLGDTAHLTTLQHGAYMLLLMTYWQRGQPLPADDRKLARIARLSDGEWAEIRPDILELFVPSDDGDTLIHKRVEGELATLRERSDQARAAGQASGRARAGNKPRTPPSGGDKPANARSTPVEQPSNERSTNVQPPTQPILGGGVGRAGAREPDEFAQVENLCREAAGLANSPAPRLADVSPIMGLIRAGADLATEILPALRAEPRPEARTWDYFVPQIRRFRTNLQAASLEPIPFARAGPRPTKRDSWIAAGEALEREKYGPPDSGGRTIEGSRADTEPSDLGTPRRLGVGS
jgi:uncharacterized protein YdaU (DUF1376 family)